MANQPDSQATSPERLTSQNGEEIAQVQPTLTEEKASTEEASALPLKPVNLPAKLPISQAKSLSNSWLMLGALVLMAIGLWSNLAWLGFSGGVVALLLSLGTVVSSVGTWIRKFLTPEERKNLGGLIAFFLAVAGLAKYLGIYDLFSRWLEQFKYDEFGSWAEWVGALGQISIAILAVYVAWAQYVISRDLTIQQNRITQQQTIDAYFQGISDLALDSEGMLEDWPQERAIAEGRTAAILASVDGSGKAKIIRFLSQSKLLTPLKRDRFLGRPIFDGFGGYEEDRLEGVRTINLGVMLAGSDLSGQDLRWTDLSEANMVRANLSHCDLVKANLSRTVFYEANLQGADFKGTRLFYGSLTTASPRSRTTPPDYQTGAQTGIVIEKANLTGARNLSEEQRYYFCAWGGEQTRATIPGGCAGIPNKLGR